MRVTNNFLLEFKSCFTGWNGNRDKWRVKFKWLKQRGIREYGKDWRLGVGLSKRIG